MRTILLILAIPVVLICCAVVVLWVPLPRSFPPPLSHERNRLAAAAAGVTGVCCLAGLAVNVVSASLQSGRILDDVFAHAGLDGSGYALFGRQYHGAVGGRQVGITYTPSRWAGEGRLDVHVSTEVESSLAVVHRRPLLGCTGCARLEVADPAWAHVEVYAEDEKAARRLLEDERGAGPLSRLMADEPGLGPREVYVRPGDVWFRAVPRRDAGEQAGQWLDDLLALAEASEDAVADR